MSARTLALFFLFALISTSVQAAPLKIGESLTDLTLTDLNENPITLEDVSYDRALIIVFNSIVCPASLKYHVHKTQIHNTYGPKGVRLIAVNANFNETNEALQKHYQENPVPFPIYRDINNVLADQLGATHTPQAFLFDQNHILRYRGEIDNGWGIPENTTSRGLWNALDALLANKTITQTDIPSFGCEIRRRPQTPTQVAANTPTFHRDIIPFLQERCQTCHRPGGIGRAAFYDYMEVLAWAHQMRDSIDARIMPPWKAQTGYGEFKHARWLSDKEITQFNSWVDAGMPEGDSAHAPEPVHFPESWTLGTPDLILEPESAYPLEAIGRDEYRCFVLPTNLTEDQYVSAIELLPGEREVVHHVSVYVDVSGKAKMLQDLAPKVGYPSFGGIGVPLYESLGGWAPGNTPFILPEGIGRHLPKGSDIVLQIHYHKIGRAVEDQSRLGIYFAKKPVEKRLYQEIINSRLLIIPPNVKNHKVTGSLTISQDEHILGIMPHMHLLGTEMKVTATYPNGEQKPLVWVKPWDFNWQETYVYKEPIALPRGTRITMEAYYDNSSTNPNNPYNPPKLVRWGEESTDEMCTVFLYVTHDKEDLLKSP